MFASQLTSYTIRPTRISYSLAYQGSQVNLHPTPPDTLGLGTASYINVRELSHLL